MRRGYAEKDVPTTPRLQVVRKPVMFRDMALKKKQRGLAIGGTGTGKSTLNRQNRQAFLSEYPNARLLIADTKPRFRAEWDLNGFAAGWRYRKWDKEESEFVPGSYRLPLVNPLAEMKAAWRLKARIVIAQVEHMEDLWKVSQALRIFYEHWRATPERLAEIDEAADFFERGFSDPMGRPILEIARKGRERNVAMQAGSQRPRGLVKALLTEMTKLFLFELDSRDDVKYLKSMGLPEEAESPDRQRVFFFFDKLNKQGPLSGRYYTLKL